MNSYLLSDVTFDLIINEINKDSHYTINNYSYTEDIVAALLSVQNKINDTELFVIHFDSFFHKYDEEYIEEIINQILSIAQNYKGNILVSNVFFNGLNISNIKNNIGQTDQTVLNIHDRLQSLLACRNVYFYDFKRLMLNTGIQNCYNYNTGFLYQMPYSKELIIQLASEIKNYISFLNTPEKKAIFVDCDDTLWKGILGEDGLENVQCNKNANGIIFYHLQKFLLQKKQEGFILGLCSKNNEGDVKQAFDTLNMPLKWNDFVIKKVNWNDKVDNLFTAAKELNIHVSSFIFIDDNEFELQSVNSIIPEIKTLKFINNYPLFLTLINHFLFKKKFITNEDSVKTHQYQTEELRNVEKLKTNSFDGYVKSLNINLDITINSLTNIERLSQLTEKTNQFNFNKKALTPLQLKEFIDEGNLIYELKVSDKFGDYGIVGLILIEIINKNNATMINYLMSCRALGRNIEDDFYKYTLNDLKNKNITLTSILFNETNKNIPAKTFFERIKF